MAQRKTPTREAKETDGKAEKKRPSTSSKKKKVESGSLSDAQRKLKTVKQLLARKTRRYWSGEDVGRLQLANMAIWNKENAEGRMHSELLSPLEWNDLIRDVQAIPREAEVYRRYLGVTYWLQQYTATAALYKSNIVAWIAIRKKQLDTAQVAEALMAICLELTHKIINTTEKAKETPDEESEKLASRVEEAFTIYDAMSLEAHQTDEKERKDVIEFNADIYEEYRALLAYNKAVELIVEELEIPELEFFMTDMSDVDEIISELNKRVGEFRRWLNMAYMTDDKATAQHKEELEQILDTAFPPLDTSHLKLSDDGIQWARRMIRNDMEAFSTQNGLFFKALLLDD